jgi:hypothetical protein
MADGQQALITRLIALRRKWAPGDRPTDKPFGRWLGDFLTQKSTPHGLLHAELILLDAVATGGSLVLDDANAVPPLTVRAEFLRFLILGGDESAPIHESGIELHDTLIYSDTADPRHLLDLRGGKCAGRISLRNCNLTGTLSIQDATLGILDLTGSFLHGLSGERAKTSGSVYLSNSSVSNNSSASGSAVSFFGAQIGGSLHCSGGAFTCGDKSPPRSAAIMLNLTGAKIAGSVYLNQSFVRDRENFALKNFVSHGSVSLVGAQIGGNLDCSSAAIFGPLNCDRATIGADLICQSGSFARGIQAQSVVVAGDVNLTSLTAKGTVTLAGAAIGGDLTFSGAAISATRTGTEDCIAINAQIGKVGGSVFFGGGFVARGMVSLYGAEISRDLDFSGSSFCNKSATAISANSAKVLGSIKFTTDNPGPGIPRFNSIGVVSLVGTKCAELLCGGSSFYNPAAWKDSTALALNCGAIVVTNSALLCSVGALPFNAFGVVSFNTARIAKHLYCGGGVFNNSGLRRRPGSIRDPKAMALDCDLITVGGSVYLCNDGPTPFEAFGQVGFYFAQIGVNLACGGGRFNNPNGYSLHCQGSNFKGCVFLNAGNSYRVGNESESGPAFWSDGIVSFTGATIGLQFNCQSGYFRNGEEYPAGSGQAAIALDLSVAKINDIMYLGREQFGSQPPTIEGSVDLTGTTVRVLVDDGFVDDKSRGLRPTVDRNDPKGLPKRLQCTIELDQFSYDRLKGDRAFESDMRKAWLQRQPPEDLRGAFKPQPFEQLVTVMRAMGYDDEADDIALFKRQTKRQTTALIDIPELDWRFPSQAAGVVAAAWLAIVGNHLIVAFIVLFWLFRKVLAKLGEILLLDWFVGYGYNIARAVSLLLLLIFGFGEFYASAFQQGAIVAVDKDVREAMACLPVLAKPCKPVQFNGTPLFNPWLYSADVMVPVVTFGQKAAWAPNPDADVKLPVLRPWKAPTNLVYDVQLIETVLGWIEGFLLVSFVTGLIAKE